MGQEDLIEKLSAAVKAGRPAALVTVIAVGGSAPREPGAKMLVYEDGAIEGTVGGGRFEAMAAEAAQDALKQRAPAKKKFELEPQSLGMYCGGWVEVFIDVFFEPLRLVILGGGHVAEQLGSLAAVTGVPYVVVDDRPEFASRRRFPQAREIIVGQPSEILGRMSVNEETYVVIVTRCHGFDMRCLVAALPTTAPYIGMIGSRTKIERLFALLERRDLDPYNDPRVHAPIGLDLGGKDPKSVALSILAEIFKVKNGAAGGHLRIQAESDQVVEWSSGGRSVVK
ncbi:MAG: hypothetical protein A3G41_07905 [Elusimicrobia bacterium RIFCSPLOWO2_12_FULL_59_9]|nr:MAG: hypothetical protein A3G41_07905 [Elusimicrobia bacterium RIFCSPLOWO2_12_FULL_59_9]